jgi:hypothetical protein
MDRRFLGVLAAAVVSAVAAIGAQAPAQAKPSMTVTGCLQKASWGGFVLASDSKSGAAKGSYALVGVFPPNLKLGELVNKKLEVVGTVGDPLSADKSMPTLSMRTVKPIAGACS